MLSIVANYLSNFEISLVIPFYKYEKDGLCDFLMKNTNRFTINLLKYKL